MQVQRKRIILLLVVIGVGVIVGIALRPSPIRVEVARARNGPLQVTIDEEGETRAHDRFVVATPVAGRLTRIQLDDGDRVALNDVVAVIDPLPLGPRERSEVTARLEAAGALKREADARVEHARADYEQARRESERAERLAKDGLISPQFFEQVKNAEITGANELEAAKFKADAAASEVKIARAALMALEEQRGDSERLLRVRSPVRGRVLRVIEKSQRVVVAGTPLLVLGDPSKLEAVIDVLSTDAVKVRPGAPVLLEGWGGSQPLRARVRVVEPSAFTKVSALGIEEQRVNIVADLVDPPGPLGDGYRVEGRIIVWAGERVLKVPSSALFRQGEGWSVFVLEGGRAREREVEVGHRNEFEAEILKGIQAGDEVLLHPTNQIKDGVRVQAR